MPSTQEGHFFTSWTTSSSSSTCSKPTFCPRECLALEPHTVALDGAWSARKQYSSKHSRTILIALLSLCVSHYRNPQCYISPAAKQRVQYNLVPAPSVWCNCKERNRARFNIDGEGNVTKEIHAHSHQIQHLPHPLRQFVYIPPFSG